MTKLGKLTPDIPIENRSIDCLKFGAILSFDINLIELKGVLTGEMCRKLQSFDPILKQISLKRLRIFFKKAP